MGVGIKQGWLTPIAATAVTAIVLVLAFVACTGRGGPSETPESLSLVPSGVPPGKVQLLVTKVDEDTVAMRSPTFR